MNRIIILTLSILIIPILTSCGIKPEGIGIKEATENKTIPLVEVFTLKKKQLEKKINIPGEILAYESVDIFPKVEGFVQDVYVDKGSVVKKGQILMRLTAPELEAQIAEAQAKLQSDEGTYKRLKAASETPGVISDNELEIAQRAFESSSAHLKSLQDTKSYLQITAPFNGIITERNIHTGALVGPSGAGAAKPIFHIDQTSHLRVVVPIPEYAVSGIKKGATVEFAVSAFPERLFSATASRLPQSIDPKTRTEQIELDFDNSKGLLSPGMYPEVIWTVHRQEPTFFVPTTALVTTTERTFIIREKNKTVEWVDVKAGNYIGDEVEVFGNLKEGNKIVLRTNDELRDGSKIATKLISLEKK